MRFFSLVIALIILNSLNAQRQYWTGQKTEKLYAQHFLTYDLDLEALRFYSDIEGEANLWLPMPDGTFESVRLLPSQTMSIGLQKKFPTIKTFKGINEKNNLIVYLGWSSKGFHAMGKSQKGFFHIDQTIEGGYRTYFHQDFAISRQAHSPCNVKKNRSERNKSNKRNTQGGEDVEMRNFRLAVAVTGEYADYHGGTTSDALAAVVTTINKVNLIYNNDLAVNLELVSNNDDLMFLDAASDPFSEGNATALINQCQSQLDDIIGEANYDVGHLFGRSNAGGLAFQGATCVNGLKGRGYSATVAPIADAFNVDYVSHEIGHQFGASHTWNHCSGGSDSPSTDIEPGSGSTIMGYAGICGSSNVQQNSDPYFHSISIEEIRTYLEEDIPTCHTTSGVVNTNPTASVRASGFFIPIETPFELIAAATDLEDFDLTYCWEQIDAGPSAPLGSPTSTAPAFRSYPPSPDPVRTFPRLEVLLNNITNDKEEVLPTYARDFNFRLTVRDNNVDAGGVDYKDLSFQSTADSGPFRVLKPNSSSVEWEEDSDVEVSWEVANTDQAPVNCATVDIYISKDGGQSFTELLVAGTPNDGSEFVVVPKGVTNEARVKIKASDNIFFDVSDQDFRVKLGTSSNDPVINAPSVELFPNPSKNFALLRFKDYDLQEFSIQLFDLSGQLLFNDRANTGADYSIDVSAYAAGVYWIAIQSKTERLVKKLIVL